MSNLTGFAQIADENMIYATTNKELVIQEVSKAFCDMFGYTKDEIIGQNYNIIVEHEDSKKFYNGCEYVGTHNKEAWGTDIKMSSKNNQTIHTNTFIYPLFDNDNLEGFTFVSKDIYDTYILNKYKVDKLRREQHNPTTLEFMRGTSVAILNTVNSKVSLVVKIVFFIILAFFIWAVSFDIEEIVRGDGTVIPTNKLQSIKNLEGGVVSIIHIKEGDRVKAGQVLVKLSDLSYQIRIDETNHRIAELRAKEFRLKAEANNQDVKINNSFQFKYPSLVKIEENRYITNKREQKSKIEKFSEQLKSKNSEIQDAKHTYKVLNKNYKSRLNELEESKILAKQGIFSKYDIAAIQREVNDMLSALVSAKEKQTQIKNSMNEIENSIIETKLSFQNKAKEEYGQITSEMSKLEETIRSIEDTKKRTYVRTPVDGIIKELLINTVGSSVSPSEELITIVPDDANIVSEIKIAPEDIGKLYVGQRVFLKVTAFDYALYGNLSGEIINISPDTTTDKQSGNTYYLIQIKTKKDYLDNNKKNKLKVGMRVNTDIIVGKKTILEFVLKPILRSTQKD